MGGRFRWISKPFKRWAFGIALTAFYSKQFVHKYLLKYLRKHAKSAGALDAVRTNHSHSLALASQITNVIVGDESAKTKGRLPCHELRASLHKVIMASLNLAHSPLRQETSIHQVMSPMQFIRSTRCVDVQSKEEWVKELSEYALGLGEAVEKNRGLDHSKVREYWLQRGPRLFLTAVAFFIFTITCQEFLRHATASANDRMSSLVINSVALIIAFGMLYFRLQDRYSLVLSLEKQHLLVLATSLSKPRHLLRFTCC